MDTNYIVLCFAMEKRLLASFWNAITLSLANETWPNRPRGSGEMIVFTTLGTTWEKMSPSSRPPFAKTAAKWNAFCGGRPYAIHITELILEVSGPVDMNRLNSTIQKYDYLCDVGKKDGIYVGGYWGNLATAASHEDLSSQWNLVVEK